MTHVAVLILCFYGTAKFPTHPIRHYTPLVCLLSLYTQSKSNAYCYFLHFVSEKKTTPLLSPRTSFTRWRSTCESYASCLQWWLPRNDVRAVFRQMAFLGGEVCNLSSTVHSPSDGLNFTWPTQNHLRLEKTGVSLMLLNLTQGVKFRRIIWNVTINGKWSWNVKFIRFSPETRRDHLEDLCV